MKNNEAMIDIPFKIMPSKGYLNSQYQLLINDKNVEIIQIFKEDKLIREIAPRGFHSIILLPFSEAGIYRAYFKSSSIEFYQDILVEDAFRYGSSIVKNVYVFDDIDYLIIVMKDRVIFRNDNLKLLFEENYFSPTEISCVDSNLLLFKTKLIGKESHITNFALYSVRQLRVIWELQENYQEILLFNNDVLWVKNLISSEIECHKLSVETENCPSLLLNQPVGLGFEYDALNELLYINTVDSLLIFYLNGSLKCHHTKSGHSFINLQRSLFIKTLLGFQVKPLSGEGDIIEISYDLANFSILESDAIFIGADFVLQSDNSFESAVKLLVEKNIPPNTKGGTIMKIPCKEDDKIFSPSIYFTFNLTSSYLFSLSVTVTKQLESIVYRRQYVGDPWIGSGNISSSNKSNLKVTYFSGAVKYQRDDVLLSQYGIDFLIYKIEEGHFLICVNNNIWRLKAASLIVVEFSNDIKYLISSDINSNYSLFNLFDINDKFLDGITILNLQNCKQYGAIWYTKDDRRTPYLFDFLSKKESKIINSAILDTLFYPNSSLIFFDLFCVTRSGNVVEGKTLVSLGTPIGVITCISKNLKKVVSVRDNLFYLQCLDSTTLNYSDNNLPIDIHLDLNKGSYLSPDGRYLSLVKDVNHYVFYDFVTNTEESYYSGKFLGFSKEGNVIIEEIHNSNQKIYDPLTFQDITKEKYKYYKFLSPTGRLYAHLEMKLKIFYRITNSFVLYSFRISLMMFLNSDDRKAKFFLENEIRLREIGIKNFKDQSVESLFSEVKFAQIGVVGFEIPVEVQLPPDFKFLNYISFSVDDKYVALVGKRYCSGGVIILLRIDVGTTDNKLKVLDMIVDFQPRNAAWVCGISKDGLFGTYDSNPVSYFLDVNDSLFFRKKEFYTSGHHSSSDGHHFNSFSRRHKNGNKFDEVDGKNFLCFSPSGKYIACSEQWYEPLTLGGYGHIGSCVIHILLASNFKLVRSFKEHGDSFRITNNSWKELVFVAFSDDETKLMSLSRDGVVVLRNLNFDKTIDDHLQIVSLLDDLVI